MDRKSFDLLVEKFLSGKTTASENELLFAFYETIERNGAGSLDALTEQEAESLFEEIRSVAKLSPQRQGRQYRLLSPKIAASITVFLLSAVFLAGYLLQKDAPVKKLQTSASRGERKKVQLPDGSEVWINAGSDLTYPDKFSGERREVSLSGEAFFKVTHNRDKPFIVHTKSFDIRVLGTVFNVKAYPEELKSETSLIEGSVRISFKNFSNKDITLRPLEKLVLYKHARRENQAVQQPDIQLGHVNRVNSDNTVAETDWTENKLSFSNKSLGEIATELERWYDVKIKFEDKETAGFMYTGSLGNEGPDAVLQALSASRHFEYRKEENGQIIIY